MKKIIMWSWFLISGATERPAEAPRVLDPRSCEVHALDESLATAKSRHMDMYIYIYMYYIHTYVYISKFSFGHGM